MIKNKLFRKNLTKIAFRKKSCQKHDLKSQKKKGGGGKLGKVFR
jgi:hypothetical protein